MLAILTVIKIVFRTANILRTWNAPLEKVPGVKNEKQLLATSLPWRFALSVRILKMPKSPIPFLFHAYEIVFCNYKVPLCNENSFVLPSSFFSLPSSLLYDNPYHSSTVFHFKAVFQQPGAMKLQSLPSGHQDHRTCQSVPWKLPGGWYSVLFSSAYTSSSITTCSGSRQTFSDSS